MRVQLNASRPWDDAGSAPHNNILGSDPGLRDPENGDFHPVRAPQYGSRIVPAAVALDVPVSGAAGSVRRDPGSARKATLTVVGDIAVDTVWDAATVMVGSDVVIRDGAVLTVAAGAGIRFTGHHGLVVRDGAVQAWGTPAEPITWDTAHPQAFTTGPDTAGSWGGLTFLNVPADNPPSFLRGCVLQHAKAVPGHGPDDDTPRVGGRCPDSAGGALRLVIPAAWRFPAASCATMPARAGARWSRTTAPRRCSSTC
ncbi:MAG: hypothetical protein IPO18_09115 [bacterium]|nr:hypothetical protein [bacterium]